MAKKIKSTDKITLKPRKGSPPPAPAQRKRKETVSDRVRAAGERARAQMAKEAAAAKRKPQTKADLAAKFNRRIDQLAGSLWTGETTLPPKITAELTAELSHRELRKLVSAATIKKSSGVYQEGEKLLPEFRRSYEEAMVDILNERRARRRKMLENTVVRYAGKIQKNDDGSKMKRKNQMGNIRENLYKPMELRPFKSTNQETYFIKNLPNMIMSERDSLFRDNIVISLKRAFKEKANELISIIYNSPVDAVLKAFYSEELFTINDIYLASDAELDNYLEILKDELVRQGADAEQNDYDEDVANWATSLDQRSLEREKLEFIKLNS